MGAIQQSVNSALHAATLNKVGGKIVQGVEGVGEVMKSVEMHDKAMQSLQDALESKTLQIRGLKEQNEKLQQILTTAGTEEPKKRPARVIDDGETIEISPTKPKEIK